MIQRTDSLEKILMLRKIQGKRKRRRQRMRWLDSITNSTDMNLIKFQILEDNGAWHAAVHGVAKSWTQLSSWTTTSIYELEDPTIKSMSLKKWKTQNWNCHCWCGWRIHFWSYDSLLSLSSIWGNDLQQVLSHCSQLCQ